MSAHRSPAERSDAALISCVRAGDRGYQAAYGVLRDRHVAAARVLARHLVAGADRALDSAAGAAGDSAEDAVAATFTKILVALRRGAGPQAGFRPYLLLSLRRTVGELAVGDRAMGERPDPSPDAFGPPHPQDALADRADRAGTYEADDAYAVAERYVDPALATNMIARAFLSLPERWRAVLWHTEVEGDRPAAVAPLLGLSPNGAAGLAYAAREGLRQSYLQLYLAESARRTCRPALDKLAAYIRGGLAWRDTIRVERHLGGCRDCAMIYAELADLRVVLRTIVGPLLLGGAAAGYLADISGDRPLATQGGLRRAWRQRPRRQRRVLGAGTAATRQ